MKPPGIARVLLGAATGMAVMSSAAFAQPQIWQTDCDTLSSDPPRFRIEFSVVNLDPKFAVCLVFLEPIVPGQGPGGECPIRECVAPPGWDCLGPRPDDGAMLWAALPDATGRLACIGLGEKQDAFAILVDAPVCCYRANYYPPFVPEPFYIDTICFECERPVATQGGTWGRIKAFYR